MSDYRLAASILNADFGNLAAQLQELGSAGVDYIHVDVMDGVFVPNITIGFAVIEAIHRLSDLPLDVHLMIDRPERYVSEFAAAGATYLTVHQEATTHLHKVVEDIKALGVKVGVALCPATPVSAVDEICADLDMLLVMTVNPGFGGQALIPSTVSKVGRARQLLSDRGSQAALEVDGGVKVHNVGQLIRAGADTIVVGTGIFQWPGGIRAGVAELRKAASEPLL